MRCMLPVLCSNAALMLEACRPPGGDKTVADCIVVTGAAATQAGREGGRPAAMPLWQSADPSEWQQVLDGYDAVIKRLGQRKERVEELDR